MNKLLTLLAVCACSLSLHAADYTSYYHNLPTDVAQPEAPTFKAERINIMQYGAKSDGKTDCTAAVQQAIDKLAAAGGGHVDVPAGIFVIAPIELKSGIDLHLKQGAVLLLTPDRTKHLKNGKPVPAITAAAAHDIAITGQGVIDGNGHLWRAAKRFKYSDLEWENLKSMGGTLSKNADVWFPFNLKNSPNFAATPEEQEDLRTHMVRFQSCERVLVEGITMQNAPKYHFAPMDCSDMVITGVKVRCPWNAQNGEGVNISYCQRVLVAGNFIDCSGDGIVLKAGTGQKAINNHKACEDIVVEENIVRNAHSGFAIGSEFVAGVNRVVVKNNSFFNTDNGLRFKSSTGRGGSTNKIYCQDNTMSNIKEAAIIFETDYVGIDITRTQGRTGTDFVPQFKDINISGITCSAAKSGIIARGAKGTIYDVVISNSTIHYTDVNTDINPDCRVQTNTVELIKD